MAFRVGDTVGEYRITAVIGSGGAADVFRVEHTITRRAEAMKVLHGRAGGDSEQRFLREIQAQASLDHPNIAAVRHAFRSGDDLVMIMELVEGESLRRILDRGRVPLATGLGYLRQILAALDYAHGRGVVHRDVTPSNILITAANAAKLTDFGLAKGPADARLTQSGTVVGSLHYMSPEQVKAATEVDARADIYSFGAVLFEVATGRQPFPGDNPFDLMLAHAQHAPPRATSLDASLPPALDGIVLKAMAKRVADRFASAEEVRAALA
ncbi:MAG: serine/threonine-protein kinase, partial [Bryobacteraceae bacterium]